ncbi:MAG: CoA-binding protein [Bacteroidetes bacterium]|nr:CoA-binding protein [Bacteroidota bacterium]MBU1679258.1 CoA-binding protein [Bacteroidota bacterium]MBU2506959.1 CoA-binding protein [Bacteroidota bacterium]
MTSRTSIKEFFDSKVFAVVGVSKTGKKFGNIILKELRKRGFQTYGINKNTFENEFNELYPDFEACPEKPEAAIVCVTPALSASVVELANQSGIKNIWLQQGAESSDAIELGKKYGMNIISKECVFMFAEPVGSIHKFHRWINKIFNKLPA